MNEKWDWRENEGNYTLQYICWAILDCSPDCSYYKVDFLLRRENEYHYR
jgi:hypothetical protein